MKPELRFILHIFFASIRSAPPMADDKCNCTFSVARNDTCPAEPEKCRALLSLYPVQTFLDQFLVLNGYIMVGPLAHTPMDMLPEKAQGKVLEATVVSVGAGARNEKGELVPISVKAGDRVLLPEYGGTKVMVGKKMYKFVNGNDIIGVFKI